MSVGKLGRNRLGPRRNTRALPASTRMTRPTPVGIASSTEIAATNQISITFDQPISLKGVPQFKRTDEVLPTEVTASSSTTIVLTYAIAPGGPLAFVVGYDDSAIRGTAGGYVLPGTYYPATPSTATATTTTTATTATTTDESFTPVTFTAEGQKKAA